MAVRVKSLSVVRALQRCLFVGGGCWLVGCCNSLPFFVIYLLIADWLIHYTVMPCSVLEMLVPQVDDYLWDKHDMGIHAMANP